jgi:hypothetical protein
VHRTLRWLAVLAILGFVAIQLVPYGRDHTNPPVTGEPGWDSRPTRDLAAQACFDCHSNETAWPWYSNIAPASWLMQRHVDEGREALNLSEWGRREQETDKLVEVVGDGEMPPWEYLPLHPEARLTDAEQAVLRAGLARTFGDVASGDDGEGGEDGSEDE